MVRGFVVYPSYQTIEDKTYIQLFGRLENGESFVVMNSFEPYFFIKKEDKVKTEKILKSFKLNFEETKLKTFEEDSVVKIICQTQSQMTKAPSLLHEHEISTFESDLKPNIRFNIDNGLFGSIEIDGDYESSERVDRIYRNAEIKSCESSVKLKIASVDIESGKVNGSLFCIGIYSEDLKKTFMVNSKHAGSQKKIEGVTYCKDEEDCLIKFKQSLIEFDPDIITGWNVIDFDFLYLKSLFDKYKIPFDLGRDNTNARIRIEENYFRNSSMDVSGRLVLDGLGLIQDPFIKEAPSIKNANFESYTLENVSQSILGKSKLIKGKNRHEEIERLYESDQKKLADYNMMDCILVYEILQKTKMIELAMERAELTGMSLDKITASIAAFDSLYIREARKRGLVSPATRFGNKEERIKGGFVMSPKPGIYHNILVLDFKSLYPSIIRTFNIDPASFLKKKEKGCIESPNGAYFKNQDGILPDIIQKLHEAREKAKKEKRELSSYAIKIIMNSFFGVLASPNCRYFDLKMGNAITNFGQEIIKLTAEKIREFGYEVIYGDTDSVFVSTKLDSAEAKKLGFTISEKIDKFYQDYVSKRFNRKSYLDLEFDKLYSALLMPSVRMKAKKGEEELEAKGAKKRYAGLIDNGEEEELEVVGMEAIRGDWTEAAQEFQKKLFLKIFHKEDPATFIKNYVKDLKSGKLDSELIYRKSIRKDLQEYTKTTPPHVKAARKLDSIESNVIEYYITVDGPEPIQKLKNKLDYGHYIDKQIKPIADQVLVLFGKSFEDTLQGTKQRTLF